MDRLNQYTLSFTAIRALNNSLLMQANSLNTDIIAVVNKVTMLIVTIF